MIEPEGARLPASVALALPFSPAATCHLTVCVPACTAVTDQRKVFCSFGFSGPYAQVFT